MNMRKIAPLLAVIGTVAATPAVANDETDAPSGPRIEAIFGYDRIEFAVEDTDEFDASTEDITYGAVIGYDFSHGLISFGVEGEIATSGYGFQDSVTDELIEGSLVSGTLNIDSNPEYYLGARLGYGSGHSLFYLKAGYVLSSVDIDLDGTVDGVPETLDADLDLEGLRLGIGFEYGLTDNFYVKTEYRYTDYTGGDIESGGESVDLAAALEDVDLTRHQVVVGAGLRF